MALSAGTKLDPWEVVAPAIRGSPALKKPSLTLVDTVSPTIFKSVLKSTDGHD